MIGMERYRNLEEVKKLIDKDGKTVFTVFVNDGDAESAHGSPTYGMHKKGWDVPIGTVTITKDNINENNFEITSNGTKDVSPTRWHASANTRNENVYTQYTRYDGEFLSFNRMEERFEICHLDNRKKICPQPYMSEYRGNPAYVFLEKNKSEKLINAVNASYNTVKRSLGAAIGRASGPSVNAQTEGADQANGGKSKRRRKIKKTRRRKRTRRNKRN